MRRYINVKKSLMPYGFNILLGAQLFQLYFKYNARANLFTVSLSRDGETLVHDEPVIYGIPLFQDIYRAGVFPVLNIVAIDQSGQEAEVSYDNFGETVALTIDDEG